MSLQSKIMVGVFGVLAALILADQERDYFEVEDKTIPKQMTIQ